VEELDKFQAFLLDNTWFTILVGVVSSFCVAYLILLATGNRKKSILAFCLLNIVMEIVEAYGSHSLIYSVLVVITISILGLALIALDFYYNDYKEN